MSTNKFSQSLRAAVRIAPALLLPLCVSAQDLRPMHPSERSVISLEAQTTPPQHNPGEPSFENAPSNFHAFASVKAGEDAGIETLKLNFSDSTTLGKMESQSKDFVIEPSGTCHEGNAYSAGQSCTLHVRFSPQGAGTRAGKIMIQHSASATPFALGIGGYGYAPVLSFTPAVITTVAGTYPSSVGLLSGAQNLTVDGSDTLYIADSGNKVIRFVDSSGTIKTLTATATAPQGIAVDTFGEVYFDEPTANTMHEIYDYGPVVQINGSGTTACPVATPCNLNSEGLGAPGTMSMDRNNNLFFADNHQGAAMATVQPLPAKLIFLYDPFPFQVNPSNPIAVDSSDNIYSLWANGSVCSIIQQSLYNAENSNVTFNKVAGGHTCGFSGDGGQAGNAEIGAKIGQMAFDLAGNLYFSDTANQRVRRIDYITGQINTIAGNGVAGYTGDGNPATTASLNSPTGIAVDSQGQVYIISSATTGQVIRKVGPNGSPNIGLQPKGTSSAAHIITVSNTGNNSLILTNASITGTNASDFKIDPVTTSCELTANSTLYSGQSCKIGFIFTPSAAGGRSASLVLADNTVTGSNTIQLSGNGTLPSATLTINTPASGASVVAGTAVAFKVTLSGTPTPTGTVTMTLDGATLAGSPATLSSGTASLSVTTSTTGSHTLKAVYNGDANWAAGTTASVTYTVTAAATKPCPTCGVHGNPIRTPRGLGSVTP
jgi:sugar lactone lactonase YvrE